MAPIRTGDVQEISTTKMSKTFNKTNFMKVMGVEEDVAECLRGDIRNLVEELLDLTEVLSQQSDRLARLDEKLLEGYPEIFARGKEEKLRWVRIYVQKHHGSLRHAWKAALGVKTEEVDDPIPNRPPPSGDLTEQSITGSQSPDMRLSSPITPARSSVSGSHPSTSRRVPQQRSRCPSLEQEPRSFLQTPPSSQRPFAVQTSRSSASEPQILTGDTELPRTPRNRTQLDTALPSPALSDRPRRSQSLVKHFSGTNLRELEGVRHFLKTCDPPMMHFFDRFVNFGCHSLALLRPVRTWPTNIIDSFLQQLPTNGGRDMTPMELLILRMHLLSYPFDEDAVDHVVS